jgi:hypothetical protein
MTAMPDVSPASSSNSASEPLRLRDRQPFGVGGRRLCFVHPRDSFKCVKVARPDAEVIQGLKSKERFFRTKANYDNNLEELVELQRLDRRLGAALSCHLPRSYGMAATDMGPGLVLDLMRDADGGISRSIRELITIGLDLAELKPAFNTLGEFFIKHAIVTRQLLDHNVVARHEADGTWTLFLIDGLGDPSWIPVSRWLPQFAVAKIRRNLARSWARFESFAAAGGVSETMRKSSPWGQGLLNHRDL